MWYDKKKQGGGVHEHDNWERLEHYKQSQTEFNTKNGLVAPTHPSMSIWEHITTCADMCVGQEKENA